MKLVMLLFLVACTETRERAPGCDDCGSGIHPLGILDPGSDNFHGKELERHGWDFATCTSCHGEDFAGGVAKVSCLGCHTAGPTACATCHGDGPTSGAHAEHGASVACSECHVVPSTWDAPGHILDDAPPAEVVFGDRAQLGTERMGPPSFTDGTCSNVYCHGATLPRAGGSMTRPVWAPATPSCSTCHGAPPPNHVASPCISCHPANTHVDGVVQVGSSDDCAGCHGDASSPAPPRDLTGATATTSLGVGAHRAHLNVPSGLRGPIACATCHVVPTTLFSVGHIDSALPAEVTASLGWNRTAATCATAACHGDGQPAWTQTGVVACGTCHGIPPTTPSHTANQPLTSCVTCHAQSVTASGAIRLEGGTSTHMNGVVDAQ